MCVCFSLWCVLQDKASTGEWSDQLSIAYIILSVFMNLVSETFGTAVLLLLANVIKRKACTRDRDYCHSHNIHIRALRRHDHVHVYFVGPRETILTSRPAQWRTTTCGHSLITTSVLIDFGPQKVKVSYSLSLLRLLKPVILNQSVQIR